MKKDSDEYWLLVKDLDQRYQKRTDTAIPIQPVPDIDVHDKGSRGLTAVFVAACVLLAVVGLLVALMFAEVI